jgi:M6 family metalloprotease-like protein
MSDTSRTRRAIAACGGILVLVFSAQALWAAPVNGKQFRLPQPDGTFVDVRIWGDEFYGVTETLDGYTLVRDPQTLFFCYADLTPDRDDLISTGVTAGSASPTDLGLSPHVRITRSAARAKVQAARERWQVEGEQLVGSRGGSRSLTTGNVQGICLIVDFSDDAGALSPQTVSNYCNLVGFSGFGNNGSVRDYYYDVSDGLLTYTNYVPTAYYRALHPKTYYTNPAIGYGQRARELITEALTALNSQGFDFSQYDADDDGVIDALNCFYAGEITNNWAEGLWPHAGWISYCADGVCTQRYQITDMSTMLTLGTFVHENGHMLMGWPDLYDYDYDSTGVGQFCLMAFGTTDTNPCEPCAYMKHVAGWTQTTVLNGPPQIGVSVPASSTNQIYKFNHPTLSNEYYLIENRQQTWRDAQLPDAGLAIWHVDTNGNNSYNEMLPESHFLVTLVQADGRWDLEHDANYGDSTDLWSTPGFIRCTTGTVPNTNWWSGSSSGLAILAISASGSPMTFNFTTNPPPHFTQQPTNQEGCTGGSVNLTVAVDISTPAYQWRLGTTNLVSDGVHILGATSATLTIANLTLSDIGDQYNCVVTNTLDGYPATSNNAVVYVHSSVSITSQPGNQTVNEYTTVGFGVTVTGEAPLTYQWRHNGVNLANGGKYTGVTSPSMLVWNAEAPQAGYYDCVVTSICGPVASNAAHLIVNTGYGAGRGDLDCDGSVNFGDINPFVLALSAGETGYYESFGNCHWYNGDINSDGTVGFADINPFVTMLSGG